MSEEILIYLINNVSTEALTTGWMAPWGTNREALTTGWMAPWGTNRETLTTGWMAPWGTPTSIGIDPLIVISNYVCLIINDN